MTAELDQQDIDLLKYKKRFGYIFLCLWVSFGTLANLVYFILPNEIYSKETIYLIDFGIFILGLLFCYLINRNINLDLKENKKVLEVCTVQKKFFEKSWEAGSGAMYIPILGDLFPKLWGQKMNESIKYFMVIDGYNIWIEKELYDKIDSGSSILIHFAKHSSTTLTYSKNNVNTNI